MPELLLELFSEEIPARMQQKAAEDLRSLITNALVEAGLTYEGAQVHAGPRRLVLSVEGLNAKAADVSEERKGPRVDAPKPAIDGFLKSTGLKLEDLKIQDDKKGKFYLAVTRKAGRAAAEIIAGVVSETIRNFPWPKSMRWGSGALRWVRPLQSIICTFDGEVVPFEVDGIVSGNATRGHRFMGAAKIEVRRFEDYAQKLHRNFVIVDATARAETIRTEAKNLAFAQGLELVEDEGLIKEVAGLVEWPVVLMGSFDEKFLELPPEVIATTIKNNQKCFVLRSASRLAPLAPQHEGVGNPHPEGHVSIPHPGEPPQAASKGPLSNKYLLVSNMVASDGGKQIVAGNNKVIAARLSDAKFFWDQDRKVPLRDLLPKLDQITFHAKLGSQGERVKRIEALAGEIAKTIGADVEKAKLAAKLAKADLVTGMVGEFPELQGLMGRYYALDQAIDPEVADAIRDHYKPQGPSDTLPVSKVGQAVALADKLDTLVGFWAIDEKPTGSKDPYALRRAALGVIRVILENGLRLGFQELIDGHFRHSIAAVDDGELSRAFVAYDTEENLALQRLAEAARNVAYVSRWLSPSEERRAQIASLNPAEFGADVSEDTWIRRIDEFTKWRGQIEDFRGGSTDRETLRDLNRVGTQLFSWAAGARSDLLSFFADRLKVYLRESGARYDLIDAVFALGNQDDLVLIVKRVEALSKFLETEDGQHLMTGVKRASNILKIEEKKDGRSYSGDVEIGKLVKGEEKALHSVITIATGQIRIAVEQENFEAAMRAIAKLRAPVDAFFEHVTVNDVSFRENRLKLLNRIRAATLEVADFSKIEG